MSARHAAIAALVVAMIAWALYMALTVAAYAHTLPMSEIRRGIIDAVDDKFPNTRVIVGLHGCRRWDRHGGECQVRVYTLPARMKYCGSGWAKLIGNSDYMHVHGSIVGCSAKGKPLGGNPLTA
jgi:hypothetical protein